MVSAESSLWPESLWLFLWKVRVAVPEVLPSRFELLIDRITAKQRMSHGTLDVVDKDGAV